MLVRNDDGERRKGVSSHKIPVGLRGERWMIMVKAIGKMLEYRAWVISRSQHAESSRSVRRTSKMYEARMGSSNFATYEGCMVEIRGRDDLEVGLVSKKKGGKSQ